MGVQGDPRPCSLANALDLVGERWTLLILREIMFGTRRFDEIALNTGVSRDILSLRLNKLVEAGIAEKKPYSTHPGRFEYHLTKPGRDLHDVIMTLVHWGDRHVTEGPAPAVWDHSCGKKFVPVVCCAKCGEPAGQRSLRVRKTSPAVRHVVERDLGARSA